MRKVFAAIVILFTTAFSLSAQTMKVALLETLNGDKSVQVKGIEMNMVRGELRKAISNQDGFQAFTRTDIDQLMKEHGFQNSGMVSDSQRKRLGEMSEADYICVSTLTKSNTDFYLEAYLIDIETGEISNSATQYGRLDGGTYANLFQICQDLSQELVGYVGGLGSGSNSNAKPSRNHDYTETACGLNMRMIYVEGGTFTMGCTNEQGENCNNDELPAHQVTLSGFYIGKCEVTVAEFRQFVNATGYLTDAEKEGCAWRLMQVDDEWKWCQVNGLNWRYGTNGVIRNALENTHPAIYISWNDALAYCEWLSRETGKNYTLPTEAQWEFAARGGNKRSGYKYAGSNTISNVAWYGNIGTDSNAIGQTHPVGQKKPNELGIYDMSGNVAEWCLDWYGNYSNDSQTNPLGPSSGQYRVLRGGSWDGVAWGCRVAIRIINGPNIRFDRDGFRVVLNP